METRSEFLEKLFGLKGKAALVVGGTSGIGRAIALGLASAGADVVASSRRRQRVEQTASELRQLGARTLSFPCDVQNYDTLVALRDAILSEFGAIDILVISSGVVSRFPSVELPEQEFHRILDTNLTGTFRALQVFGRPMIERQRGAIINIASIGSFRSIVGLAHYTASKAGVVALTESLACEWAPHHVRVNAIAPGSFPTELNEELLKIPGRVAHVLSRIPMNRFGELTELVGAAIYLASDAASFVTGATITVDGGFLAGGL